MRQPQVYTADPSKTPKKLERKRYIILRLDKVLTELKLVTQKVIKIRIITCRKSFREGQTCFVSPKNHFVVGVLTKT